MPAPEEQSTPAHEAAVELWSKYKDELPQPLVKQLQKASTMQRKAAPAVDPARAERALKRLEAIFGESDRPICRFT